MNEPTTKTAGLSAEGHRYQPYYCEENVWWLCQAPELHEVERRVVFITNRGRSCHLCAQRAGDVAAGVGRGEVVWDYHVVLFTAQKGGWQVWDQDSLLGMPVMARRYLASTFARTPMLPKRFWPMFRVVAADDFLRLFSTDRRHMRRADGSYLQPPPPWPAPRPANMAEAHTLPRFIDLAEAAPLFGDVLDLAEAERRFT
jgi:hypothetical protein